MKVSRQLTITQNRYIIYKSSYLEQTHTEYIEMLLATITHKDGRGNLAIFAGKEGFRKPEVRDLSTKQIKDLEQALMFSAPTPERKKRKTRELEMA